MMYSLWTRLFFSMAIAQCGLAQVCAQPKFSGLACLSSNTNAAAHCTSVLAAATATTTSTKIKIETRVVTASSHATVTADTIISSFLTVGSTSTAYVASYVTATIQTTITSYSSTPSSTCDVSTAETALSSLSANNLSTACSCIGALPTTLAGTKTVYKTITKTVTHNQDIGATTTLMTGVVFFTESPVVTEAITTFTSIITQTSTVAAAATTYTQVFGPQVGCVDLNQTSEIQLNSLTKLTDIDTAISQCQSNCTGTYLRI